MPSRELIALPVRNTARTHVWGCACFMPRVGTVPACEDTPALRLGDPRTEGSGQCGRPHAKKMLMTGMRDIAVTRVWVTQSESPLTV